MREEDLLRYSRQINLPQIDVSGQLRLLNASVLVVGAGGLGQPAALYLAGAGIGRITVADADVSDISNLHRQPALDTQSLGCRKSELTAQRMRHINPGIEVQSLPERLDKSELKRQLAHFDLALDGCDNFKSRFALAEAGLHCTTPVVSAAVTGAEGQIAFFANDSESACYGCLYSPEAEEEEQSCAESGVLGPMAGVMGSLQALEAVKYLSGSGENLKGELLLVDGWRMGFRRMRLQKDPDCALCSGLH